MSSKRFFENEYCEYSANVSNTLLNDYKDPISEKFNAKLYNFKTTKISEIIEMEKDTNDGTVYTGSGGLALYYLMSALRNNGRHEILKTSVQYLNLDNLKGKRISFLCGDAGPLALATVISYKFGNKRPDMLPDYKTLAQRLMDLISLLNASADELLYGKAGYLYALLFVNKNIPGKEVIPANHIEKVISSILKSGKQFSSEMLSDSPLLWQWHEKIYFGAAHGMAGILYILLQARIYININDMRNFVKPSVDWLLNQRFASGNFPSSMNSSNGDNLVQWCHGAPGFVALCILAHQVYEEERYLNIALECGDVIWQRGLCRKGYSLCHGVSGNAYAFIQLYQCTKKPNHLYRACCFMEWCALEQLCTELHHPDRPASLFEGALGRVYLAEDLSNISEAKFPAFTV